MRIMRNYLDSAKTHKLSSVLNLRLLEMGELVSLGTTNIKVYKIMINNLNSNEI